MRGIYEFPVNLRLFYGSKDKSSRQLYPICDAAAAGGGIEGLRILEENLLFPDEEIDQQRGGGDGAFLKMPRPQLAYFLPVTVHSVTSNLRKSILNSLREWDLLTPESLFYRLCSECKVLCEQ